MMLEVNVDILEIDSHRTLLRICAWANFFSQLLVNQDHPLGLEYMLPKSVLVGVDFGSSSYASFECDWCFVSSWFFVFLFA